MSISNTSRDVLWAGMPGDLQRAAGGARGVRREWKVRPYGNYGTVPTYLPYIGTVRAVERREGSDGGQFAACPSRVQAANRKPLGSWGCDSFVCLILVWGLTMLTMLVPSCLSKQ